MSKYTIEADFEQFTEADTESLEFDTEDLEDIGVEAVESNSLEDVNPGSVAEALGGFMEGGLETNGHGYAQTNGHGYAHSSSPSSAVNQQLLKTFTIIIKKLVKKIMSNPKARTKLQAAVRKGPNAVAQLLTPSVAQVLPSYFRWMAPIYVPPVVQVLFNPVRKQAGVKAEEVEASPEILPWLALGAGAMFAKVGLV